MMGMGTLEVIVILLVAFVFLGPRKMIDGARFLGKLVLQVRQMADEIPNINLDEDKVVEENGIKYDGERESSGNSSASSRSDSQIDESIEAPISFKSKKSNKDSEQPRIPMTNVTSSEEEKLD